MCTGRPGWQTMSFRRGLYKDTHHKIYINLVDVLKVDTKNMSVRVEPLVTMGQLSATLSNLGYALAVVPEIDDLTVGGMVNGTGVESSSHVYGLFQHICLSYEIVLSDGSVTTCSKDENSDLFYSVPWSHGTLGFLTAVELKIVPAKRFIKLKYQHANSQEDIIKIFSAESFKSSPAEFIEGLVFNRQHAVIMTGDMVDSPGNDGKANEIGKWYKPWFFSHVMNTKDGQIEYIPLRQYYHRHTRSLFWELQDIIPFGNNPLFRLLLGWLMPPKVSLMKITQTEAVRKLYEKCHCIQDMLVPLTRLKSAIDKFHSEIEIYPIWLCPFKLYNDPGMIHPKQVNVDYEMYVDIGVYGVPQANNFETVKSTRNIEDFVTKNDGFQMLYADTYTTREEFRKMFDHKLYDSMRIKLQCENAFPELYDKVNKNARI
ncbi:delta(24)-sterol reductase-like isoform X2 [Arctopsyche grandis]